MQLRFSHLLPVLALALWACSEPPPEARLRLAETPASQKFQEIPLVEEPGKPGWRVAQLPDGSLSPEKGLTLLVEPLGVQPTQSMARLVLPGWVDLDFSQNDGIKVTVGRDRVFKLPMDRVTSPVAVSFVRDSDAVQGFDGYAVSLLSDGEPLQTWRVPITETGAIPAALEIQEGPGAPLSRAALLIAQGLSTGNVQSMSAGGEVAPKSEQYSRAGLDPWMESLAADVALDPRFAPQSDAQLSGGTTEEPVPDAPRGGAVKLETLELGSMLVVLAHGNSHCELAGIWDLKADRAILSGLQDVWRIARLHGAEAAPDAAAGERMQWRSRRFDADIPGAFGIEWTRDSGEASVSAIRLHARFVEDGLDMRLEVQGGEVGPRAAEIEFPRIELETYGAEDEALLLPYMCGELRLQPSQTLTAYEGRYPSARAAMGFWGLYDSTSGVYCGIQDPGAAVKDFKIEFLPSGALFTSKWFLADSGGDNELGIFALRRFSGDWYDAAMIYGRWLAAEAPWFPAKPRTDSPSWIRENLVWVQGYAQNLPDLTARLGLPLGFLDYSWSDQATAVKDIPHHVARPGFAKMVPKLMAAGVRVVPYTNVRIWDQKDRGEDDYLYSQIGLPSAARLHNGELRTENYQAHGGSIMTVMCPSARSYTDFMDKIFLDIAKLGVSGIYLDQLGAGMPLICFDESHGHPVGCGRNWIERGYGPWISNLRTTLRAQFPELALTTEDNSEVVAHLVDGYLPWRQFAVQDPAKNRGRHVPVFQTLYAGRVQFVGRNFDQTLPPAGYYAMLGEQLVWGEQLFWGLTLYPMRHPARTEFLKRCALTRRAFLEFFNEGNMERPPRVAGDRLKEDWGYFGPRMVESSAVMSAEWSLGDHKLILFVNTTHLPREITFEPAKSASGMTWLRSSDPSTLHKEPMPDKLELSLPPYAIEALLITPEAPAENLVGALTSISTFAAGMEVMESLEPGPDRAPPLPEAGIRAVRIEGPYSNIHLAEVEIFAAGKNVASGGRATQSSTGGAPEVWGSAKAIDGNKVPKQQPGAANSISRTGASLPMEFWEIDLGTAQPIDRIVIHQQTDKNAVGRLSDARLVLLGQDRQELFSMALRPFAQKPVISLRRPQIESSP